LLLTLVSGCGTTKSRLATEQLLMSDAVDRTIAEINFGPLAGRTVFFDATYIQSVKALGFVNSDYVISALRQQMVSSGCLLEDDRESADFIVEGRVGALGTDGHEIVYGVPASTGVSDAASLLPNTPSIPMIPEISVAKKQDYLGATKIALFAYHRESRERVWQSGVAVQTSNAKDIWFFGAGPFTEGTIYKGPRFAGMRLPRLFGKRSEEADEVLESYYAQETYPSRYLNPSREVSPEWEREIEALVDMPELLPHTLDSPRELPRRLPQGTQVADRPETTPTPQDAEPPAESPQPAAEAPKTKKPAPAADASKKAPADESEQGPAEKSDATDGDGQPTVR
jgi:hypothetical protein